MKRYNHYLAALSLAIALPVAAAPVVGISSGDTLTIAEGTQTRQIRLAYIAAPELRQPHATQSRQSLSQLCMGKNAQYDILATNRQKQAIAIVHCNGINANRHQVANGMAWVYDKTNQDDALPGLQEKARKARIGLWKDNIVTPPWEFKRRGFIGRLDGKSNTE